MTATTRAPGASGLVGIDRRYLLFAAAGLTGAALAAPASARPLLPQLDLTDPRIALETYVKLRGSTADETVFQPYEGDIFMMDGGKPGPALCGFKGLQKSIWRRTPDGGFANTDYDIGFYVDYRSREILTTWANPLTGKTVEVFHYRGGPSGGHFAVGAASGDVYGDHAGRWSVLGDAIWHSSSHWGNRPNPMLPAEWPEASSGPILSGSMSLSYAGRIADVVDPAVHMAPSYQIWTNATPWMPWMEMGQRPGFNLWRWIGAKGTDPASLPPHLVTAVERVWPGYVSRDSGWKVPTAGVADYMRLKRGLPVTQ